jgi:hypothetical protein
VSHDDGKIVERGGTYCDFCDELISRHRLTIYDLMKKGGTVVQLLEPTKFEAMMGSSMGTAQTIQSLEDGIACSKECAEKLLRRFVRKRPEEQGRAFVALSGQELKRLGAQIDTKAYVAEAWDGSKKKLTDFAGRMGTGAFLPTTFDAYANVLDAPQEKGQLSDGEVMKNEVLSAVEEIVAVKKDKPNALTSIEALLSKGKSAKFLK